MSTQHELCPECGHLGKAVGRRTVESLLRPEIRGSLQADDGFWFCRTPGCSIVYFRADSARSYTVDDLRVRVGQKQPGPPTPVCYCFGHTEEEIMDQVRDTGACAIAAEIAAKVRVGDCACETENPEGTCCLGNVRRAMKLATGDEGAPSIGAARSKAGRTGLWVQAGVLMTALLASACCWLPLALVGFGASAVGASAFFEEYRLPFALLTLGLLGVAFYLSYRPARGSTVAGVSGAPATAEDCCTVAGDSGPSRLQRWNRILLWPVTAGAIALLLFPDYVASLIGSAPTAMGREDAINLLVLPLSEGDELVERPADLAIELGNLKSVALSEVLPGGHGLRLELAEGDPLQAQADVLAVLQGQQVIANLVPAEWIRIPVTGMTCEACAVTIADAVWRVDGVGGVVVDADDGLLKVLAENEPFLLRAVADAVVATDYGIGPPETPRSDFSQDLSGLGCCTVDDLQ